MRTESPNLYGKMQVRFGARLDYMVGGVWGGHRMPATYMKPLGDNSAYGKGVAANLAPPNGVWERVKKTSI